MNRDYLAMGEKLSGKEKSNNDARTKALSELQTKKQEVLSANHQLEQKNTDLKSRTDELYRKDTELGLIKADLDAKDREIEKLTAEHISVKKEYLAMQIDVQARDGLVQSTCRDVSVKELELNEELKKKDVELSLSVDHLQTYRDKLKKQKDRIQTLMSTHTEKDVDFER
jgi:chromosome segregation ATPase